MTSRKAIDASMLRIRELTGSVNTASYRLGDAITKLNTEMFTLSQMMQDVLAEESDKLSVCTDAYMGAPEDIRVGVNKCVYDAMMLVRKYDEYVTVDI